MYQQSVKISNAHTKCMRGLENPILTTARKEVKLASPVI